MALTNRDRRALILGGTALAAVVLYVLLIEPVVSAYDQMVDEHDALAARIGRVLYDNQQAKYFTEQVAEWEQAYCELGEPKRYDEQITTVSGQIVAAAQSSGIKLGRTSPASGTPWADDPKLQMALIHLDAEGGWEKVFKFVAALYRIQGLLSVEHLDLSAEPKKPDKIKINLTVSVLALAAEASEDLWAK